MYKFHLTYQPSTKENVTSAVVSLFFVFEMQPDFEENEDICIDL